MLYPLSEGFWNYRVDKTLWVLPIDDTISRCGKRIKSGSKNGLSMCRSLYKYRIIACQLFPFRRHLDSNISAIMQSNSIDGNGLAHEERPLKTMGLLPFYFAIAGSPTTRFHEFGQMLQFNGASRCGYTHIRPRRNGQSFGTIWASLLSKLARL